MYDNIFQKTKNVSSKNILHSVTLGHERIEEWGGLVGGFDVDGEWWWEIYVNFKSK